MFFQESREKVIAGVGSQCLVGAGANTDMESTEVFMALMVATHDGHLEVAEFLVGAGATKDMLTINESL